MLSARNWLGLISIGAIVALFLVELRRTAPGELTRVHAQDPGLDSPDGCSECHGGWFESVRSACGDCHERVLEQLGSGRGFHGQLEPSLADLCAACHLEHKGPDYDLVGAHAFALAGFSSRDDYDHPRLDYELDGAHDGLDCVECHLLADAGLLHEGEERYTGRTQDCVSCHEEPHGGLMARACEECHGQVGEFVIRKDYVHHEVFALQGAHAGLACLVCHPSQPTDSPHSLEALTSAAAVPPARACDACHASPHRPAFLEYASSMGDDCATCHSDLHDNFADPRVTLDERQHVATGFELRGPHGGLECAQCHADRDAASGRTCDFDYLAPGRLASDCAACHEDYHGGQFATSAFAARGCATCHSREAFQPPAFDIADHDRTDFPLEGSHAAVGCYECHLAPPEPSDASGAPRVFHGTSKECATCHEDAHLGAFKAVQHASDGTGCAQCHTLASFDSAGEFDHGLWTEFPLNGAHEQGECEICHERTAVPDAFGRRFGRAAKIFGEPAKECATCHHDVHDELFDRFGKDEYVDGHKGCARCHGEETFSELAVFDHERWTGFPLEGAHERESCEVCHARTVLPDAHGRTFGRVRGLFGTPPERCATCHADVHEAIFERPELDRFVAGRESCARCHGVETLAELDRDAFDHEHWTGYELESAHADAKCEDCHIPFLGPDEFGRTFGYVKGPGCADCHEDSHVGQFAVEGTTDCTRCHTVSPSFEGLVFDHDRDSRYPLDDLHAPLECSACHLSARLSDGREAVRYRPLGMECGDCHLPGALPVEDGR